MKKTILMSILFVITLAILAAQVPEGKDRQTSSDSVLTQNPFSLIGLDLAGALSLFGAPDEVFTHRGETAEYDDAVFFWKAKSFYLFWFENRVWVVRFDRRYPDAFFGVRMGMNKDEALKILAFPVSEAEGSCIFLLKDEGYPVRLRLYFENDLLVDAYLYRGDF